MDDDAHADTIRKANQSRELAGKLFHSLKTFSLKDDDGAVVTTSYCFSTVDVQLKVSATKISFETFFVALFWWCGFWCFHAILAHHKYFFFSKTKYIGKGVNVSGCKSMLKIWKGFLYEHCFKLKSAILSVILYQNMLNWHGPLPANEHHFFRSN